MVVPGLILVPDFLSKKDEQWLADEIDAQEWIMNRARTRRIQVYGPYHNAQYKIIPGKYSKHPEFIAELVELLFQRIDNQQLSDKLRDEQLTEVYINEYTAGQTLQQHFDHRSTYEENIIGISCLSDVQLAFSCGSKVYEQNVPRRSLYIMSGDSRFKYKHGIRTPAAARRLSVTFRTIA